MQDDSLKEPTIASETIYKGKVITLQVDTVSLPNGKQATREIVRHPGAVAVLALTAENRVVLVRQFRKPCEQVLVEIPAGKLEQGEDPETCAKRELQEETGYQAKEWRHLHSMFTSPGFANECIHLYLAKGLIRGEQQLDQDEFLHVFEADMAEAKLLLESNAAVDAKTITALYWWFVDQMQAEQK